MRKRYLFGRGGAAWVLGIGGTAWALAWQLATPARIAGRGVCSSARLQAADSDDLLSGPDLECEGAATAADDGVGAVIQRRIQTRRAERSSAGSSLGRPELELCLSRE